MDNSAEKNLPSSGTQEAKGTKYGYWRFVVLFLACFLVLELAYYASRDTVVERMLIDDATVSPSAALINAINPAESVRAEGHRLVSPTVRLSVLNGCEGTETILLLIAAIIASAARWKHKLIGVLLGTALVYVVNQGRIAGLYYALRYDKLLFDMIHGYIGPTLIVIIAGLFFLWWVNHSQRYETVTARDH